MLRQLLSTVRRPVIGPDGDELATGRYGSVDFLPGTAFVSHTASDSKSLEHDLVPMPPLTGIFFLDYRAPEFLAQGYKRTILQQLRIRDWFLVAVSEAALKSEWVRFEVKWAFKVKRLNRMIALRLDDTPVDALNRWLAKIMCIDCRSDLAQARRQLCELIPEWRRRFGSE